VSEAYAGKQIVGMDLHRRRSVLVRMTEAGERLETVRISNDPEYLRAVMARAGEAPEVVLEAAYGWYWAADTLAELGAKVHLAHPLGVKMFCYRRVKNDERDAADLADLLRMGRLPEAWIAPPATRELRELVRHRAKLVALRSSLKCQVHAVLASCGVVVPMCGVVVPMSDLFGVGGQGLLERVELAPAFRARVDSARRVIEALDFEIEVFTSLAGGRLRGHPGYTAIQTISPQEKQIALLARDGLSNLEVGARLFLSPRTVEWHLRKVFAKLAISSRRELRTALCGPEPEVDRVYLKTRDPRRPHAG
jgi:DNA-binding CsgD family transcriptional regulator